MTDYLLLSDGTNLLLSDGTLLEIDGGADVPPPIHGRMYATFSANPPRMTFSAAPPAMTFEANPPTMEFSVEE